MTFDQFLDVSATQDFLLKEGSVGSRDYVFENSAGQRLHIRALNATVTDNFPMWTADLDGDRIVFDEPSQLISMNTIVTGLCSRSIQVLEQQIKKEQAQ